MSRNTHCTIGLQTDTCPRHIPCSWDMYGAGDSGMHVLCRCRSHLHLSLCPFRSGQNGVATTTKRRKIRRDDTNNGNGKDTSPITGSKRKDSHY